MSTTIATHHPLTAPALPARNRTGSGVSARGVLRSEWIKLRSVRSSTTTLVAAAALMVFVGLVFSASLGGLLSGDQGAGGPVVTDSTGAALSGMMIAQLVIGDLGVLVITSEYSTGMIRTTLTAVPRRLSVLWAKAAVVTVSTFPVMLVASIGAFLGGQVLIGMGDLPTASIGDAGVLRAVVGTAAYLTGIALMGLAIGTLLRSTAAAISTLVGVVFLLPGLGMLLLPSSVQDDVLQLLPSNAGASFTNISADPVLLESPTGAIVFALWVFVPLALAAVSLKRRGV